VEFDEAARARIAEAVRQRRGELGLSQEETARASGGMISTANLRVMEGSGRSSFRPKSLVGVARALSWPADAIALIARGADPASFPSAVLPDRSASVPGASAAGVELATSTQLDELRHELALHRAALAEVGRRLDDLVAHLGPDAPAWRADVLAAAHSGDTSDAEPAGPRRATRPRVESFEPDPAD